MNTLDEMGLTVPQFFILIVCVAAACAVWEWINREPPTPPPAVAAVTSTVERDILLHRVATIHPGWSASQIEAEVAAIETPPVESQPSARERYDRAIAAYVTACDEWNAASINLRNTTHYTTPTEQAETQQKA